MGESSGGGGSGSDAVLLNTIRSGDPRSFDQLRRRHEAAARRLAGYLTDSAAAADEVTALTFARVLDAIRRGGGPTDAFRPYLLTAVRRAARDGAGGPSRRSPPDEQPIPDLSQAVTDPAADRPRSPVVAAFLSLPERWRAVLWHTEVEGAAPEEIAPLLGMDAPGAAALADRARDGLAREYGLLGRPAGDPGHADPRRADPALADLGDIGTVLRATVGRAVLGETAAAYLADVRAARSSATRTAGAGAGTASARAAGAGPGAARTGAAGEGGAGLGEAAATGGGLAGWLHGSPPRQRRVTAGLAAVLVLLALGGYALTRSQAAGPGPSSSRPSAAGTPGAPVRVSPPRISSAQPAAPSRGSRPSSGPSPVASPSYSPATMPGVVPPATPAVSPTSAGPATSKPVPVTVSPVPVPPRPTMSPPYPSPSPVALGRASPGGAGSHPWPSPGQRRRSPAGWRHWPPATPASLAGSRSAWH